MCDLKNDWILAVLCFLVAWLHFVNPCLHTSDLPCGNGTLLPLRTFLGCITNNCVSCLPWVLSLTYIFTKKVRE